jgi:acetyltransferase
LPAALRAALEAARGRASGALSEDEAARLIAHFGVAILPSALAGSADQAVAAAERLGFPVVLKAHAAALVHKSDAGGVQLDLRSADEVRRAFAVARSPSGEVRVTPLRRGGVEAMIGVRRDPQFGPIALFGAGGVLAEVTRDSAIRTLPCGDAELEAMIASTRLGQSFRHPRGAAAIPTRGALDALTALARLVLALPEVEDAEINPLLCGPDGALALDARVLVIP